MQMKITKEMVQAGKRALAGRLQKGDITQDLVCQVWRAMAAACPPIEVPIPEGATPRSIIIQLS